MFYSGTLLRTIAQETASETALRNLSKDVRKEPGYVGVLLGKKKQVVEHQKITVNHKNQTSQVNDFLYVGRCKILGSLKLFLRCAS